MNTTPPNPIATLCRTIVFRIAPRRMAAACRMALLCAVAVRPARGDEPAVPTAALDRIVESTIKPTDAGMAVGVVRDGKLVFSAVRGMADLEHAVPVTSNTIFETGSVSKQFTAACVVLLAEEGKLSLNDDVRKHIPELPDYGTPITIDHLLHHTSGIKDYTALMAIGGYPLQNYYPERWVLDLICRQKALNFKPGEQWMYSNSGYFLLSVIVHRASGQTLRQYAQEHVFKPLEMSSTHFNDDQTEPVPNRAISYVTGRDGPQIAMSLLSVVGDGGVNTTIADMAKWVANFDHNRLGRGNNDFVQAMTEVGVLNDGKKTEYARGLFVGTYKDRPMIEHSGGWFGYRAEVFMLPKDKLGVVVISSGGNVPVLRFVQQIANAMLGNAVATTLSASVPTTAPTTSPATVSLPEPELSAKAGWYRNVAGATRWRVFIGEHRLYARTGSGAVLELHPSGGPAFWATVGGRPMTLTFDVGGTTVPQAATVIIEGQPDIHLERADVPAPRLEDFTGRYTSGELAATFQIHAKDGALWLSRPYDDTELRMEPSGVDEFEAIGDVPMTLKFSRDTAEATPGRFVVATGRTSGTEFVRDATGR